MTIQADVLSSVKRAGRFDPSAQLPATLEYHHWRAARLPAGRHWKARRAIGRRVDAVANLARKIAVAIERFADLVHGQPIVGVRINWAAGGPRRVNRFVSKEITQARLPFDPADLVFLADYCRVVPEALDGFDAELRAAVLEMMKRGGVAQ